MNVTAAAIPGVKILEPRIFRDERGHFFESYNRRVLASHGLDVTFVQDNQSRSVRHVVRGLHYQVRQAQGKLIHVTRGEVLDVAVDIRRGSPTFGRHVAMVLSADHPRLLWIPPGFAHGYAVRSAMAEVTYKTTDYHAPEHERAILWCDPDLGIDWGLTGEPILSPRDLAAPPLSGAEVV